MSSRQERAKQEVTAQVNALPNLTDEQRAKVLEIAEAYANSNHFDPEHYDPKTSSTRPPNYEGIANFVRSRS